jgi:pimeloyl-ACP methyl ester carboxylesterase
VAGGVSTALPEGVQLAAANGLTLAYQTFGDPSGTPLLLIMGLGSQMISWPDEFCEALAARGYFVVRFDNRDIGLSTHLTEAGMPDIAAFFNGQAPEPAYLVEDMADDTAALLSALSLAPAHVVGVSMGGMIAQALAIHHPGHVRSLTSIMSTPSPAAGPSTPEALGALMVPAATTKEESVEQSVRTFRIIGSPGYPFEEDLVRAKAAEAWDRDSDRAGRARQLVAVLSSPDRAPGLAGVTVPTLVIHGSGDPLITPPGGRATAAAVPGAELVIEEGMGHDLPRALWDSIIGRIDALARRADAAAGAART